MKPEEMCKYPYIVEEPHRFMALLCGGTLMSGMLLCMFDNGASLLCVHNGQPVLKMGSKASR
jgi:hypothetical protein